MSQAGRGTKQEQWAELVSSGKRDPEGVHRPVSPPGGATGSQMRSRSGAPLGQTPARGGVQLGVEPLYKSGRSAAG